MRFQRIFWVLLFLFPNSVLAQITPIMVEPIVAEATSVEASNQKTNAVVKETLATTPSTGSQLQTDYQAMMSQVTLCKASLNAMKIACAESLSPEIATFVGKYGTLLQGAGMAVASMADQCEGIGSLLGAANIALGAYQVACASSQGICNTACSKLQVIAQKVEADAQAAGTESKTIALEAAAMNDYAREAMASQNTTKLNTVVMKQGEFNKIHATKAMAICAQGKISVENAVVGAIGAAQGIMTSKKCNEKTASTGIDCSDPKNVYYNQKNCMCTRNELPAAECQNMTIGTGGGITAPAIALGGESSAVIGEGGAGQIYGSKASISGEAPSGASGGALPGAPTGGGSVGASGGSGGGAQDGSSTSRRLNTNILGGGFGGSGGGGGSGSGPGYGQTDPSLKAYAPGGSAAVNREVAAEVTKQVTNPGGRSNWEKVRSRYTDHIRTLTGR